MILKSKKKTTKMQVFLCYNHN